MNDNKHLVLDCTLRDGGLALEDASINGVSDVIFDNDFIDKFINEIKSSNIDIIELGAIEISDSDKRGFSIHQSIEEVSRLVPQNKSDNQMYVALFRGPDTPIDEIPEWKPGYCEGIRVIIRYSEIDKSLEFCKALAQKGYKVFVQPMLTMRYSNDELMALIDATNELGAFALYLVDSYGYMQADDILRISKIFDDGLNDNIYLGFHAHNNINLAFSNVKVFMDQTLNRPLIIDSTILGMGQGAGNMQTELLLPFLMNRTKTVYNYNAVLEACELVESYWSQNLWGYSVLNLLPAINKTAYKYAAALRNTYKLSYSQINDILGDIPDELRHRYTVENTKKLISESSKR